MDMWSMIRRGFQNWPDNIAVIHGDQRVTYRELEKRINKLVNIFQGLGLKKGDRVSICGENSLTVVETQYALVKSGLVWAPLNFRNHPKEHAYHLNNAGSRAVVMQQQFAEGIDSARDEIETVEHFIVDGEGYSRMEKYSDLMDKASDKPTHVDIDENDPLGILHTSGTTGKAKGCVHTHRNWIMMTYISFVEMAVQPGDVAMYIAPVNHGAGILLPPHFMVGAPNVLISHLDVDFVLNTIQKERVTTMFLAPTIIYFLLAFPDLHKYDLSSLKTLPYSASPIAPEKLKEAIGVFGEVFLQAFGLVECPEITMLSKEDQVVGGTPDQERRLASAGRPVMLTDVRVVDDDGNEMPTGEIGEIIARSPLTMKEYWRDPKATAETLKDGWMHSGDMGYMDEGNYLFVADRKKDMVITGGYNVYPKEVEDAIFMHPAVLENAVIGVPDDMWGESLKAIVVLRPGTEATEEEIIEVCRQNLASYKKPRSVEFVEYLPKNLTGKVLKRELREKYWAGEDKQVH